MYRIRFMETIVVVLSTVIMLQRCSSTEKNGESKEASAHADFSIGEVDSIIVDYPQKLVFIDFSEVHELFLFLSSSQELVLVNPNGEISTVLKVIGDSPDKCGRRINHATFDKDGDIVIASERAFSFFNLEGEKIKEDVTPNFDMIYVGADKRMQIVEMDGRQMAVLEPKAPYIDFDPTSFEYENIKTYMENHKSRTIYDLERNQVHSRNFGNEEGSIHLKLDYRYRDKGYRLCYDEDENKYYMINNPEHIIYTYSLKGNDYVLEDRIKLSPDHFRYVKKFELTEFSGESIDQALKYNSNYLELATSNDKIFVFYRQGIPETPEEVTVQEAISRSDNYLMILDKQGTKLGEDILLPTDFRYLFYVDEEENLYFYPKRERPDYELFYKVKTGSL